MSDQSSQIRAVGLATVLSNIVLCVSVIRGVFPKAGVPTDAPVEAHTLTVDHDSIAEKTVLARNSTGVSSTKKHFAMAKLSPFLRRHPALAIVENFLVIGMFCVFLRILIRENL